MGATDPNSSSVAAELAADAEAYTSTNTSTYAAADHVAAVARAVAETYASPVVPAHALADAAAVPVATPGACEIIDRFGVERVGCNTAPSV